MRNTPQVRSSVPPDAPPFPKGISEFPSRGQIVLPGRGVSSRVADARPGPTPARPVADSPPTSNPRFRVRSAHTPFPPFPDQTGATPTTADRRVAKAEMLRRDMDWSSDDALTPAPKTYARDFYYDSDDDSPAPKATPPARPSAAARRAARDGRAAALTPTTTGRSGLRWPAQPRRGRARLAGSSETSNPGASLCEEGDRLRLGFDVPRSVTGAFELYERAATEHDYPPAFFRLGNCFSAEGLGAPGRPGRDYGDVVVLARRGDARGHAVSCRAW